MVGRSFRQASKTSSGAAQSRPMTTTRRPVTDPLVPLVAVLDMGDVPFRR